MRLAEQGSQLSIDISRPTREPYVIKYSATDSAGNEATPVALRFNVECPSVSIFQLTGFLQLDDLQNKLFVAWRSLLPIYPFAPVFMLAPPGWVAGDVICLPCFHAPPFKCPCRGKGSVKAQRACSVHQRASVSSWGRMLRLVRAGIIDLAYRLEFVLRCVCLNKECKRAYSDPASSFLPCRHRCGGSSS